MAQAQTKTHRKAPAKTKAPAKPKAAAKPKVRTAAQAKPQEKAQAKTQAQNAPYTDVLIVGGGISGIGTACRLERNCPEKSYVILEGRERIGGTWDLFQYPGIRSDSDMHTLGYDFKPWEHEKAIADGPSIMEYLHETAEEYDVKQHIRYNSKVVGASWSTPNAEWTVDIEENDPKSGKTVHHQRRARILAMCSGYYDYESPHDANFADQKIGDFKGTVAHPQFWPKDLDYKGKKVVVIGSGATAMTIVPAMADSGAGKVTMLQRTPTYVISLPARDAIANFLRKILPAKWAYAMTRFKNIQYQRFAYGRTRTKPQKVKERLLGMLGKELPQDMIDRHFTPPYNPWDQRLCLIPDSDLYNAINRGDVDVVTSAIDRFTEKGVRLADGSELEADIIVTATGLRLKVMGGVKFAADNRQIDMADTIVYKGVMYSDFPNMIHTFGYINASWTLRADLTAEFLTRAINHMDATKSTRIVPQLRESDKGMEMSQWITDFTPGYMQRSMHLFPQQGANAPWFNTQNYTLDKKMIYGESIADDVLVFDDPRVSEPKTKAKAPKKKAA